MKLCQLFEFIMKLISFHSCIFVKLDSDVKNKRGFLCNMYKKRPNFYFRRFLLLNDYEEPENP